MAKKKNNEYLKQNRQVNPACNYNGICPAAHQNTMKEQLDILNRKYTLGYLLVILVVGWIFLGRVSTDDSTYFSTLMIYTLPLLWDSWRFRPFNNWLKLSKFIQVLIFFIVFLISICGATSTIVTIRKIGEVACFVIADDFIVCSGKFFAVKYIWLALGIGIALMAGETFAYRTAKENAMIEMYKQTSTLPS